MKGTPTQMLPGTIVPARGMSAIVEPRTGRGVAGSVTAGTPPPHHIPSPKGCHGMSDMVVLPPPTALFSPQQAQAEDASVPARARTVRLIGPDNGMGLGRDRKMLAAAFREAGWQLLADTPPGIPQAPAAVQVFLEVFAPQRLMAAKKNVVIPNPEWWAAGWTPYLRDPSVSVWAKSHDSCRIFRELRARCVRYVGFRSMDRIDADVPRQRAFLHVAGASPNKGTAALLTAWHRDWPPLVVLSAQKVDAILPPNVQVLGAYLSDQELQRLQNECIFHIYPSRYEGFGHAQWEGLSCGSIVFATAGPPFSEHPEAFWQLQATAGKQDLVTRFDVAPDAIGAAVAWAHSLGDEALREQQAKSRRNWMAAVEAFKQRIIDAVASVEDHTERAMGHAMIAMPTPPVPPTVAAGSALAGLPPLLYIGRVDCVTGQGSAARHQIHLLRRHGLRLRVVDAGSCASPDPRELDPFVQGARRSDAGTDTAHGTIIHLQPNTAEVFHRAAHHPRPHILVSVWETTRLPKAWVPLINSYDQVWCATQWQAQVYLHSGIARRLLRVVPFALDPSLYPGIDRTRLLPGRPTVFGSVFQWTERKDPEGLIGAYASAFSAEDPVLLLLKTYEGDDPSTSVAARVEAIVLALRLPHRPPAIQVLSTALDTEAMTNFYRSVDFYVSAHRGEGFGMPIAEALLCGRPVIATGWSAPAEYAAGCFRAVRYSMTKPHRMDWQPFYTPDQLWAQADQADLIGAFREAHAGRLDYPGTRVREQFAALASSVGAAAAAALREVIR